MFIKDFQIRGIHATYWKALAKTPQEKTTTDQDGSFKPFERYIDVYMVAPVIGALYGKTSSINTDDSNDYAGMLAAVLIKNQAKLKYIYRLVMLLDQTSKFSEEERINRAFRDDANDEAVVKNMQLFNSYFLGGLEILYDTLTNGCTTQDDYVTRIYEFVDEFKKEQEIDSVGADLEELLQ